VRSHPNIPAGTHILDAKARAVGEEPARHRPAVPYKRLSVPYKPGLRRPVVSCTPVGPPGLRTRQQVPPNQRPVLRSRNPESNKPAPMRSPLKIPKRLLRERELYSSPIFLVLCRRPYLRAIVAFCRTRPLNALLTILACVLAGTCSVLPAIALRGARKLVRGLRQELTEEELYRAADDVVQQLKLHGRSFATVQRFVTTRKRTLNEFMNRLLGILIISTAPLKSGHFVMPADVRYSPESGHSQASSVCKESHCPFYFGRRWERGACFFKPTHVKGRQTFRTLVRLRTATQQRLRFRRNGSSAANGFVLAVFPGC
jgi:hypothetical protein